MTQDVPETALDIVKLLTGVATLARAGGWRVHMAMEAGEDQSVTFSASLWTKPPNLSQDEG